MPTIQNKNTGMHPLQRDWLLHTNSATYAAPALGSGAVIATFSPTGKWLKGIDMTTPNTPAFIIRDGAATIFSFASGAVGAQRFQPMWHEFKNAITVSKPNGTAEAWGLLLATSAKDIAGVL